MRAFVRKTVACCFSALLLAVPALPAESKPYPGLSALDADIRPPVERALAILQDVETNCSLRIKGAVASYLERLSALEAESRERGNLTEVLAIREEKQRWSEGGYPEKKPGDDKAAWASLRTTLDDYAQKVKRDADAAWTNQAATLVDKLRSLEKQLTRKDRLDEAVKVHSLIGDLEKDLAARKARLQPGAPDTPSSPSSAATGKMPLVEPKLGKLEFFMPRRNAPVRPDLPRMITRVAELSCYYEHFVVLKENGEVLAFGLRENGTTEVPSSVEKATHVAAGKSYSMALLTDGRLVAWGGKHPGQWPARLENVRQLAAGVLCSAALMEDGSVTAWGEGMEQRPESVARIRNATKLSMGYTHGLALLADGTVAGFGNADKIPDSVRPELHDIVDVLAGAGPNIALRKDGRIFLWPRSEDPGPVWKNLLAQLERINDAVAIDRWGSQSGYVVKTRGGTWQAIGPMDPGDREHFTKETRKFDRVILCNLLGLGLRYY